jgi:hypothetical protein
VYVNVKYGRVFRIATVKHPATHPRALSRLSFPLRSTCQNVELHSSLPMGSCPTRIPEFRRSTAGAFAASSGFLAIRWARRAAPSILGTKATGGPCSTTNPSATSLSGCTTSHTLRCGLPSLHERTFDLIQKLLCPMTPREKAPRQRPAPAAKRGAENSELPCPRRSRVPQRCWPCKRSCKFLQAHLH